MTTVCDKIDAFERYVLNRQLHIAKILGEHFTSDCPGDPLSESAFVVLAIGLAYFEMIEQFATGQETPTGQVRAFFERGFGRVYPRSEAASDISRRIYQKVRCGMYHTAMPKDRCGLSRELPSAFAVENGVVVINPAKLIDDLIDHFSVFCSDLRDGMHCELRRNFETMFDRLADLAPTTTQATTLTTPAPWDMRGKGDTI